MKNSISTVVIFILIVRAQAQIYIVGDTTGRYTYYPEYAFEDASVEIKIDCDDSTDLVFGSHTGGQFPGDWPRLSFGLDANAAVLNSGIGAVTRFHAGDTIRLSDDIWTHSLDFIWGRGVMGDYGWAQIDTAYIAFRKINTGDSAYVFLKISTSAARMNIHQIISECAVNPMQVISAIGDITNEEKLAVYPSPFSNRLTFRLSNSEQTVVLLYDFLSRQMMSRAFTNSTTINTQQFPAGVYFYELRNSKGKITTGKIIRQ